jgi:hypothetical protein
VARDELVGKLGDRRQRAPVVHAGIPDERIGRQLARVPALAHPFEVERTDLLVADGHVPVGLLRGLGPRELLRIG